METWRFDFDPYPNEAASDCKLDSVASWWAGAFAQKLCTPWLASPEASRALCAQRPWLIYCLRIWLKGQAQKDYTQQNICKGQGITLNGCQRQRVCGLLSPVLVFWVPLAVGWFRHLIFPRCSCRLAVFKHMEWWCF